MNCAFAQIIGAAKIYIAPAGTTIPAINATPAAPWVELGATDGDQTFRILKETAYFSDNDTLGDSAARNNNGGVEVEFTLVGMTLENVARIINNVANVTTSTSGGVNVKELGFGVEARPTEYALVMRGETQSSYGLYPAQNYVPRGVWDGDFEQTQGKDTRIEVDCTFHALSDCTQATGREFGWTQAQIS